MDEGSRELLQEFTNNFLEFRDSVLDVRNNFENFELSDGAQKNDLETRTKEGVENFEKEIAEFEEKLKDTTLSEDDRLVLEAKIRDRKDRIKTAKEYVKETGKKNEEQEIAYRDKLREAITKMTDSLMLPGKYNKKYNVIDTLRRKVLANMENLEISIARNANRLREAKTLEEKKAFNDYLDKLNAEYRELETLLANFDKFEEMLESISNKYIKNHRSVDVVDLQERFGVLNELADYFDNNVLEDMLTVNFKTLSDGRMALDIRCGHYRVSPNPIIKPTDNIEQEIMRNLNAFAFKYSEDTGKSISAITGNKVRVKVNGEDKAKIGYDDVPAYGKAVLLGKDLDEELNHTNEQSAPEPTPGTPGEGQPAPEPAPAAPGEGQPTPEPAPGTPGEGQPVPEPAPGTPGEGQPAPEPAPGTPGEGQPTPEPAPGTPGEGQPAPEPAPGTPEEGQPTPEPAPGTPAENGQNIDRTTGRILDSTDLHALKVNARRAANKQMYKSFSSFLGTAAIGLGFAGATLGFGLAPAAFVGGAFLASTGFEMLGKLKENIKYAATKRKFKKIAKRVEKELDILIEPVFDTKRRDCGFVLVDEEGNQISDGYLKTETMRGILPQGLDDQIIEIFDEEFARANKYRGKGESASSIKQIKYREFPPITFDNAKAAFNEFGGVKSMAELNGFAFDADRYVADVQENRVNNTQPADDVEEVNPEELTGGAPTPGQPAPEPAPGTPGEGQPVPEPAPAAPGEGQPAPEPAPAAPGEGQPAPEPAPAAPGEGQPAPEPAPAAPGDSIDPNIQAMMDMLGGAGSSLLPENQPGEQDTLTPAEQVVQVVNNLVENIGEDQLTFDNIQAELENQINGGFFTLEQTQDYIAEVDQRYQLTDEEKAALNQVVETLSANLVGDSRGREL